MLLGSHCWWGTIANPLHTFLRASDLFGKTLAPFMTHGTCGPNVQDIPTLCPDSNVLAGLGVFNRYQVSTRYREYGFPYDSAMHALLVRRSETIPP